MAECCFELDGLTVVNFEFDIRFNKQRAMCCKHLDLIKKQKLPVVFLKDITRCFKLLALRTQ